MANRYFEAKEHTKLYQKYRQTVPEPLIERVMGYLKEKFNGELDLAVDVGCGSGQNTFAYADHFKKVIGFDVSPNQIEVAKEKNHRENVVFEVSPAEKMNLEDGSVQLVTVMAAVHWFDIPKFFKEVERILCPGGILALYVYSLDGSECRWAKDPRKNEALMAICRGVALDKPLVDYWAPASQIFFRNYRDITIPFEDFVRDEGSIYVESEKSLAQTLGEIQTYSAFPLFKQAKGEQAAQDFLTDVQRKIVDVVREDLKDDEMSPEDIHFVHKLPFVLLMGRKASS